MDRTYWVLPTSCTLFNHNVREFCLPTKVSCDNNVLDGLITRCGEQWNCMNICDGDNEFYMVAPSTGTMMFQLNFYDVGSTDKINPDKGWGDWIFAEIYAPDGSLISKTIPDFASRWMVAHSGKYSYQNIEIDFSLIDAPCFYIKFFTESNGEIVEEVCTQHFRRFQCTSILEIEGVHTGYDCWNNFYGKPKGTFLGTENFDYSNKIYVNAGMKFFEAAIEKSDANGFSVSEITRVTFNELVPPFLMRYIAAKILPTKNARINGGLFLNRESSTFQSRPKSSMFYPILEFESVCGGQSLCN